MTPDDFRRIALALEDAVEGAHMGHPDFRVGGRVFATLAYPDDDWGMVKVTPEQQNDLVQTKPAVFTPVNGAWGRQGCTRVRLAAATAAALGPAMRMAWESAQRRYTGKSGPRKKPAAKGRRGDSPVSDDPRRRPRRGGGIGR